MEKFIYKLREKDCCCPTCRDFKKEYECYKKKKKCNQEKIEMEESKIPDNTYGINPYVFDNSRNRVYLNYTGKDRLKWLK